MIAGCVPDAVFECDEASMLNVKVDSMERYKKDKSGNVLKDSEGRPVSADFVYVEEPVSGRFGMQSYSYHTQRVTLDIYFCKFEPMHNDAYRGDTEHSKSNPTLVRLALKEEIEETEVRPFIAALAASGYAKRFPGMLDSVRVFYPSPRFDANEVSVGVEIELTESWCPDDYNRPRPLTTE